MAGIFRNLYYFGTVKQILTILTSLLFFVSCKEKTENSIAQNTQIETLGVSPYFSYALQTAQFYHDSLPKYLAKWRQDIGFDNAGNLKASASEIYLAALFANVYKMTKELAFLEASKNILVNYGEYKKLASTPSFLRPEYTNGIPSIPNFFLAPKYAVAAQIVLESGICNQNERAKIEEIMAETADFLLVTQEWGAMNRAMLRAEGLLLIAQNLKKHSHYPNWQNMGNHILQDNISNWSIEDASLYNIIWLYSICGYAYNTQKPEILQSPILYYYFEYFKKLYCPSGVIPDFGDAWWQSWWAASIPVFESGANAFHETELKWLATDAFNINGNPKILQIDLALKLSEAILWGNESLKPTAPTSKSQQVLDDAIGKKIVFRNGWTPLSSYFLLNYQDEGSNAWLFKNNLKNTLSVAHEKMHHGHNDENSIIFWQYNGAILLHDGGYRPSLPSGPNGAYRADIFHNKLIARSGTIQAHKSVLENLKTNGYHNNVGTFKIDFITAKYADYSRTRLIDHNLHIEADRAITYLKDEGIFVLTDIVKSTRDKNELSLAVLWHTQSIKQHEDNWFITSYDSIGKWKSKSSTALFSYFLDKSYRIAVDEIERHKQREKAISISKNITLQKDEYISFNTVLIPINKLEFEQYKTAINYLPHGKNSIAIEIKINGNTYIIGQKIDLDKDLTREWPRPKYRHESGKIQIADFETDGHFFLCKEFGDSLYFQSVNCTKVLQDKEILFSQPSVLNEFSEDEATPTADAWKVRVIEKTFKKK